jgi:hypothetical protein
MKSWKAIAAGLIVVTMTATPLLAQQGPGGQGHFQEQDTDGDNLISEQEWLAHQSKRFAEIDTDGDGFASEKEMKAHHKSMQRDHQRSRRGGKDN